MAGTALSSVSSDFGAALRAAREQRGITLRDIANSTKISVAALEALERNDISRLPGGIFTRAFVRSYAAAVGLEPEQAVQEFMARFPQESVTVGHPTSTRLDDSGESDTRTAAVTLRLLAICVALAAWIAYFVIGRPLIPRSPTTVAIPESPTVPQPGAASGSASSETARLSGSEAVAVPGSEATPLPGSEAAVRTLISSEPLTAPRLATPPETGEGPSKGVPVHDTFTVRMSARAPCWVSVAVDGVPSLRRLLAPGEQHTFEVRSEIVLTAGNAGALALTFNGDEAKPLGRTGEVVTKTLTASNFKSYLATP